MDGEERSSSGGRGDWQVRLATAVGAAAGAAVALLWRPDLGGFWPGFLGFAVLTAVGGVLGRLAGGLLFRPSS
jgi:hypothetical protein